MQPQFLTIAEISAIHRDQIDRYGGSHGLRDKGALQSAMSMPSSGIDDVYFHEDLYAMAAAYLYHLVLNHPFIDGNKRVGTVAAIVFLGLNGIELEADLDEFETLVIGIAEGQRDKAAVAAFFRIHGHPQPS